MPVPSREFLLIILWNQSLHPKIFLRKLPQWGIPSQRDHKSWP
ncbi:11871_t:CDS:1, partial [Acaulospora colombiana]